MARNKIAATRSTPMHSLQRAPTKAERESQKNPRKNAAEAIAMRRVVVEMGYWLSPFMKNAPLPVLTEWERTVELMSLDSRRNYNTTTGRLIDERGMRGHDDEA